MPLVFMYGPDTLQGRMFDRIGPSDVRGPAVLEGHRLAFDKPNMKRKREGLANLVEAREAETFGVVFDLSAKQIEMLDGFFGGYEQRRVRPRVLPAPIEGEGEGEGEPEGSTSESNTDSVPVTATAWVARRTGRDLRPGASTFQATIEGMEENQAPAAFIDALKEFEPLPSETIELMIRFEQGFAESEARTLMEAAGGVIRRRMRTDQEDEVMLLVKIPRDRIDVVESDLGKHPKVTLVERNSDGYRAL